MPEENPGRNPGKPADRPSLLELERFLLGELEDAAARSIAERAESDPELAGYLEGMRREKLGVPLETMKRRLGAPAAAPSRSRAPGKPEDRLRFGDAVRRAWGRISARPGPGLALAGLVLGFSGLGYLSLREPPSRNGMQVKGMGSAEIVLESKALEYHSGEWVPARTGDTLFILYRSPAPVFCQVWHQEDGSAARPLAAADHSTPAWPASLSWQKARQSLVLEADWRRQEILVLCSQAPFGREAALSALSRPDDHGGPVAVSRFRIERKDAAR
jgi:hypothetical protein